jgi:hypothetical protein
MYEVLAANHHISLLIIDLNVKMITIIEYFTFFSEAEGTVLCDRKKRDFIFPSFTITAV